MVAPNQTIKALLNIDEAGPASADIAIDDILYIFPAGQQPIDLSCQSIETDNYAAHDLRDRPFHLLSGKSVLASFKASIPATHLGIIFGRSHFLRLGIEVTVAALNPGYKGRMPVLITNKGDTVAVIKAGLKLVQLCLVALEAPPKVSYSQTKPLYHNVDSPLPVTKVPIADKILATLKKVHNHL